MKSLNPTSGGPGIPNGETVTLVVRRRAALTAWQEVVLSRVLTLRGGMLRRKDQRAWTTRRVLLAVSLTLGVVMGGAACSSDSPPEAASTSVTFGSVPSQPEPAPEAVSAARDVIAQVRGLDQLQRHCVTLRMKASASLAESLAADGPDGAAIGDVVADCDQAIALAPQFEEGMASGADSPDVQICLRDVFLALSPAERADVTAVVTGVGDDEDQLGSAAQVVAGVNECRGGAGR